VGGGGMWVSDVLGVLSELPHVSGVLWEEEGSEVHGRTRVCARVGGCRGGVETLSPLLL